MVSSPVCIIHTAVTHVIKVLERLSLTCYTPLKSTGHLVNQSCERLQCANGMRNHPEMCIAQTTIRYSTTRTHTPPYSVVICIYTPYNTVTVHHTSHCSSGWQTTHSGVQADLAGSGNCFCCSQHLTSTSNQSAVTMGLQHERAQMTCTASHK